MAKQYKVNHDPFYGWIVDKDEMSNVPLGHAVADMHNWRHSRRLESHWGEGSVDHVLVPDEVAKLLIDATPRSGCIRLPHYNAYSNKMLVLVGKDDREGLYTFAYRYDGSHAGVITLRY
mgnify:FL=1|tara:strand:- start:399 stop:755 length:357 start_codon:yes stop_codon:yes gene_type:complete